MITGVTLACLSILATFEVLHFPLPHPDAHAFVARVEPTGSAELFILHGHTLSLFPDANPESRLDIPLRQDTRVIDVADINGDGRSELITVAGDRIVRYSLSVAGAGAATELFQLANEYSDLQGPPRLQVLVLQQDGTQVLALPVQESLELRSASGNLVQRVPLEPSFTVTSGYAQPFSARAQHPPQLSAPGSLELRITHQTTLVPQGGQPQPPGGGESTERRRGTARHLIEAAGRAPEGWPWFPLQTGQPSPERVLYAAADTSFHELLVRIRREQVNPATGDIGFEAGPARRYPGVLVTQELDQPDFNGDGYADLFLWASAESRLTVNALTRAAASGKWPLLLMSHLYSPEKGRFEPRIAGHLTLDAPIGWFLDAPAEAPLRHIVLADFNGDGRTDFACGTEPDHYAIWLYTDSGFGAAPTFQHRFSENLRNLSFTADLSNRNRVSIGLRGENSLYLVRPGANLPAYPPPPGAPPGIRGTTAAP